jgi:hypothetical protein
MIGKLLKALYSGAVALLGSLVAVLTGSTTFSQIHDGQWVAIALAALVAAGGTYGLAGWPGPSSGSAPGG